MKTIRWNVLRKKIPGLDIALDRIKKLNPDHSNQEIAEALNQKFEKELNQLQTRISEYQVRAKCSYLYKKNLVDFVKDIPNIEPDEITEIFKTMLPETSYNNPVEIEVKNPDNPRTMFINSPMIGLVGSDKVLERSLRIAQARKCDTVIIPGNLIWLDLKRYSNQKPIKAEFVDEEETEEVTFRSFKVKFDRLVRKLQEHFLDENNNPHFKGKVLISLGKTESELVGQYTNGIIREIAMREKRELRLAHKELEKLSSRARRLKNKNRIKSLEERIRGIEERMSYTNMSNVDEGFIKNVSKKMIRYIIYVYEKALGAKVISYGQVFLNISGMTFQVDQNSKDSAKDNAIKNKINFFREAAKHYDLPYVVAIAGRANTAHSGAPISYKSQKKGDSDVHLEQLPVCINNRKIIQKKKELIRVSGPFLKAVSSSDVAAGVVIYQGVKERKSNEFVLRKETYPLPLLLNDELFAGSPLKLSKLSYISLDGDHHIGSLYVVFYNIPEPPHVKYHVQITHDFLQYLNAPITLSINLGDLLQGHHFPFESRPPKDLLVPSKILRNFHKLSKKKLMEQIMKRGIFPCQKQIEEYERIVLDGHEEYFLNMIKRAKKQRISFSGDLSPITILGGNHFINTLEKEVNDGVIIAGMFRNRLSKQLRDLNIDDPEDVIKSPHWGDQAVGGGVLRFPQGGEYAITVRHKATGGAAKFDDPIRKIREAYRKRGTTESWQQGRFTFHFSGHTHRGGFSHAPNESIDIGGSQVFHDPFGEKLGFPLNYIASKVIGVPKKGIEWGPIVRISLEYSFFSKTSKHYKKWEIDPDVLFELSG